MPEPTFFGISKIVWEMINSFANWFAAAGSLAAAGVALYLASRAAKPSALVTIGHRILLGPGSTKPYPELVLFNIVNTGDRPIRVIQIGWRTGLFRKRYAVQMYDESQSSPLPIELSHGQEATWMIPLSARDEPWTEYFARDFLLPHYRTALRTLRGRFITSVGHVFEKKPEQNFVNHLKEACVKLKNAS